MILLFEILWNLELVSLMLILLRCVDDVVVEMLLVEGLCCVFSLMKGWLLIVDMMW